MTRVRSVFDVRCIVHGFWNRTDVRMLVYFRERMQQQRYIACTTHPMKIPTSVVYHKNLTTGPV